MIDLTPDAIDLIALSSVIPSTSSYFNVKQYCASGRLENLLQLLCYKSSFARLQVNTTLNGFQHILLYLFSKSIQVTQISLN